MVWLILGMFYLLLVSFFLGAFALSRRADDQAQRTERQQLETGQAETAQDTMRIHRLVAVDGDHASIAASPLTSDNVCDKRLAG